MTSIAATSIDGFDALVLDNGRVSACFVPELGGRLVSLRACGGREWMYHPGDALHLWRNRPGDVFRASTHVGLDECLPTVAACMVDGLAMPDHGACWSRAWLVDDAALAQGLIRLRVDLPDLGLSLERSASVVDDSLILDYRLTNRGGMARPWGWAFHGLLNWREGDRIILPDAVRSVAVEGQQLAQPLPADAWSWPSPREDLHLDVADLAGIGCAKLIAGPLADGWAALESPDGQRLSLHWDAARHPWLGLWITRGGYLGQHGIALEPTNIPGDSLERHRAVAPVLEGGGSAAWRIRCRLTDSGA